MFGKYAPLLYSHFQYMVNKDLGLTQERTVSHRIPTVDSFLDINAAEQAVDLALLDVLKKKNIANMWWTASNPRLGGATPRSLWCADPFAFPNARDEVMNVAFTILTFTPEPGYTGLVEQKDTEDSLVSRAGRAIGRMAADLTVR